MWVVRTVLVLLLLLLVVAFAYKNFGADQVVDVNLQPLFSNYVDVPLVTVVFWAFLAGAVLAMILFVTIYIRLSMQIHTARKKIRDLESEVTILRNRPIEESAELLKGVDKRTKELDSPFNEAGTS